MNKKNFLFISPFYTFIFITSNNFIHVNTRELTLITRKTSIQMHIQIIDHLN